MSVHKISDAEWKVMHVLWKLKRATGNDVIAQLANQTDWSPQTVRTLLRRLAEKGVLRVEKVRGKKRDYVSSLYTPLYSREECALAHSESFLERVFNGNAHELIVHFAKKSCLSTDEVKELQDLLDHIPTTEIDDENGTTSSSSQNASEAEKE